MDTIVSLFEKRTFWVYLSEPQRDLLRQGAYLIDEVLEHGKYNFTDYSFVIFPFAKAYEGYLKQIFLDLRFISRLDYISDHLRLGKLMSPNLVRRLGDRSLYGKIEQKAGTKIATELWEVWKLGRNRIFHYFPHNIRSVNFTEARGIIDRMITAMELAYVDLEVAQARENRVVAQMQKHFQ